MALLDRKTIELGDGIFIDCDPQSEYVNIHIDGNKGHLVKKVDLWAACFAIADAKTQEMLLPVRQTEMVTHRRIHRVEVKKGIKPGGFLTVKCEINVPQVVEEGLAGSLMKKRSSFVLPRK